MKRTYHTINQRGKVSERELAEWMTREGQLVLPQTLVEMVEECQVAVEEVIQVTGRRVVETLLEASAGAVVGGPPQRGVARAGEVVYFGRQAGSVKLGDRKLTVEKPRLRRRGPGGGEVAVPAYQAMQNDERVQQQMLGALMKGISTRNYGQVIPEMAGTVGVSRTAVSREMAAASERQLQKLLERPLGELSLLVIYLDGMGFGEHAAISAVGVDEQGQKHVLGIAQGATENAAAVEDLLENLLARGVDRSRKVLFVVDGGKAIRTAINRVFGGSHPVQRCRTHKLRNVLERLPKDQQEQTKAAMRAAWKWKRRRGWPGSRNWRNG